MLDKLFSMSGRICLITGGSRGLGYQMAQAFLEAGAARVYITARKAEACEAAAEELSQYGDCVALPADVSNVKGIEALSSEIMGREDKLHVLVNNAGTGWGAPYGEFPEKGWDKVMDINVKTPFFLTQALTPMLEKASEENPCVINTGSIAGIVGSAIGNYSYGPSKAAVHQLTRNLALELAPRKIRVNAIAPGRFFSRMTEYVSKDKDMYEAEIATIPLHRWGGEGDIEGIALLLASRAGAFITGEIITVDGGTTLVG